VKRRWGAWASAVVGALALCPFALAGGAAAGTQQVSVQFAQFGPAQIDVLPGETVAWTNASPRLHTVTSDTGVFASGDLPSGAGFAWTFAAVGAYPYHCTVHPGMTGEVDVRRVTLGPLPTAVMSAGTSVVLVGRTADPSTPVRIERSGDGAHFATVSTVTAAPTGDWSASLRARATGDYRAASGSDVSEVRRLLVSDSHVKVRATRRGVAVTVTPSDPYARVVLQLHLREHFGWWPTAHRRLDYVSHARFPVRRSARARVALVDDDGWTPLAISRVIHLKRAAPRILPARSQAIPTRSQHH
jgi:plastocyanin